jgi:hypothetical protein
MKTKERTIRIMAPSVGHQHRFPCAECRSTVGSRSQDGATLISETVLNLFPDLAFRVLNLRLPQFDRIPLWVMQAGEPAVGIRLRVNLDRDSGSL